MLSIFYHHHHHLAVRELGVLLTLSGLTHPLVSSPVLKRKIYNEAQNILNIKEWCKHSKATFNNKPMRVDESQRRNSESVCRLLQKRSLVAVHSGLYCDAVQTCCCMSMFRRNIVPPSSGLKCHNTSSSEDGSSVFLRNTDT
jgi:hypothetical protein